MRQARHDWITRRQPRMRQKPHILLDAGRHDEADAVLRARNANPDVSIQNAAETEQAIQQSISDLRDHRFKRTGSRSWT